jgi:hypothetical protein
MLKVELKANLYNDRKSSNTNFILRDDKLTDNIHEQHKHKLNTS